MQGFVGRALRQEVSWSLSSFGGMLAPPLVRPSGQQINELIVALVAATALATDIDLLAGCIGLAIVALIGLGAHVRDRALERARLAATALGGLQLPGTASVGEVASRLALIGVLGIAPVLAATACAGDSADEERSGRSLSFRSSLEGAGGQAEVTAAFNSFHYDVRLVGLPEGDYRPVVMGGSCDAPGVLVEELGLLFAGAGGTADGSGPIATSLNSLASWHIAVLDTTGALVACGS